MVFFDGYWPWWLGALALAAMGLLYYLATGKAFGVSTTFEQLPDWLLGRGQTERAPTGISVGAQLVFFLGVLFGGLLAAWSNGTLAPRLDLGELSVGFLGDGAGMWLSLLAGGTLVGFGTRMMGGCTSGHGLSGCSRLEPGSLLGTVTFCGAAVATAFAMQTLWAG